MRRPPEDLEEAFAKANQLLDEGDLPAAVDEFRRIHAVSPFHSSLGLGKVALYRQDYQAARDHLLHATRLDPGSYQALCLLGAAYLYLEDLDRASECIETAALKGVDLPEIHFYRGLLLERRGNLHDAVEELRLAVVLRSQSAEYQTHLGRMLASQGSLDGAIHHLTEAIRIQVDRFDAYNSLARLLVQVGKERAAVEFLNKATQQVHAPELYRILVDVALVAGNKEQSRQALEWLAINLEEGRAKYLELATGFRNLGDLDRSEEYLKRAINHAPEDWQAWYALGTIQAAEEDLEAARESFARAAQLNSAQWKAHNALGLLALREGQLEEALECFQFALAADPEEAAAMVNLATVYQRMGRVEEARDWAEAAMERSTGPSEETRRARLLLQELEESGPVGA